MLKTTDDRYCYDCGSDRIQSADAPGEDANHDYCFDCGYVPDCPECFDTREVFDFYNGLPGQCGECA